MAIIDGWDLGYENLLFHIKHHDVRDWLMDGAKEQDANHIMRAIERLDDGQLQRRFARMLSGEHS